MSNMAEYKTIRLNLKKISSIRNTMWLQAATEIPWWEYSQHCNEFMILYQVGAGDLWQVWSLCSCRKQKQKHGIFKLQMCSVLLSLMS